MIKQVSRSLFMIVIFSSNRFEHMDNQSTNSLTLGEWNHGNEWEWCVVSSGKVSDPFLVDCSFILVSFKTDFWWIFFFKCVVLFFCVIYLSNSSIFCDSLWLWRKSQSITINITLTIIRVTWNWPKEFLLIWTHQTGKN